MAWWVGGVLDILTCGIVSFKLELCCTLYLAVVYGCRLPLLLFAVSRPHLLFLILGPSLLLEPVSNILRGSRSLLILTRFVCSPLQPEGCLKVVTVGALTSWHLGGESRNHWSDCVVVCSSFDYTLRLSCTNNVFIWLGFRSSQRHSLCIPALPLA